MDTQQQILVEQRVANAKKSTGVAYLLWFFLGSFGAHRFYLGRGGTGVAQLILIWGGIILSAVLIGLPMLIIGGLWVLIDAILIPGIVSQDQNAIRSAAQREVAAGL